MSKLTIAEVKRRLSVGTQYTGEFCGDMNTASVLEDIVDERIVTKQGVEMISQFLTGSRIGKQIYLNWKGVSVREEGKSIIVSQLIQGKCEDFLKITIK